MALRIQSDCIRAAVCLLSQRDPKRSPARRPDKMPEIRFFVHEMKDEGILDEEDMGLCYY